MMTVGVDPHKRTHTAVAVDEVGGVVAEVTVADGEAGHMRLVDWARGLAEQRRWAIEDGQGLARRLASALIACGESVVWVPVRLMSAERRAGRARGKSDPIDATATARAVLREPDLPAARLDGPARDVRLLVDHREHLVGERVRIINRLRWLLHDLGDGLEPPRRGLTTLAGARRLAETLAGLGDGLARDLAIDCCRRLVALTGDINTLTSRIETLVAPLLPRTLTIPGVGALTAAKILGQAGDIRRFRSSAAFARTNGTAPIPVWTGDAPRHRLNRGGNRAINTALHIVAVVQARSHDPAIALLERHRAKPRTTSKSGLRVLKRHLSDVIYRAMRADLDETLEPATPTNPAHTPVTCEKTAA